MTGHYFLWYVPRIGDAPPIPLGVYDHASVVPGTSSIDLGDGGIAHFLRSATAFEKKISDALQDPYTFVRLLGSL